MKTDYLKMMIPMTLATLFAHAYPSNFTQTNLMNPQSVSEKHFFPQYDNRMKFDMNQSHFHSAGISYERLKLQSTYFGAGIAAYEQGVGLEALGGYNFLLSPKDRITPVAGLSYCRLNHDHYLSPVIGMLYEHAFTDRLRLGANFKTHFSGDVGFSLGIPCTVQIDEQKKWEFEVQPYIVHVENWLFSNNATGIQASLGYRF